jgi:hypothetical protein
MIYAIPAATAFMLGYIMWSAAFRMRRDRIKSQRESTRGKFAFRPKDRLRFLLSRSFPLPEDKPGWEEPIVSDLARLPANPATPPEAGAPTAD